MRRDLQEALVSIHAPARGATSPPRFSTHGIKSFNPRPRTGGDRRGDALGTPALKFQSTPPHGGRQADGSSCVLWCRVSIHAPARGATCLRLVKRSCRLSFNPRPRTGGDRWYWTDWPDYLKVSIHAPARGATWRPFWLLQLPRGFQSTPPHGGRRAVEGSIRENHVSIHAPARGATGRRGQHPRKPCFNPRPRTGGDRVTLWSVSG